MMHKFHLNADLREVFKRLAGHDKIKARVAESRGADPVSQNTQVEILSLAPECESE